MMSILVFFFFIYISILNNLSKCKYVNINFTRKDILNDICVSRNASLILESLIEALNIFKYGFPMDLYIMNMVRYTKEIFEVKYYILLFKIHAKQDKEMK